MQIFVDADACPVVGIVEKVAKEHSVPVTLLCDTNHVLSSDYSEVIVVGAGADAVDYKLISICHKDDIVVSQDYGVAAMALGKGAYAIHQSGKWYTNENIDQMLMERHLNKKARRASGKNHLKGPRKRTAEDDEHFRASFEFFKEMSRQKGVNCFSAGGKSNIIRQLEQRPNEEGTILVIVDGAAFGSEMKDISECIKTQGNIVLYAPESFEWLLLSTKEMPEVNVETILQNPEEYIDSKEYVSWERYFTDLLIESTSKNFIWAYSKKRLTKAYFAPRIVNAVKTIMKLVDWEKLF